MKSIASLQVQYMACASGWRGAVRRGGGGLYSLPVSGGPQHGSPGDVHPGHIFNLTKVIKSIYNQNIALRPNLLSRYTLKKHRLKYKLYIFSGEGVPPDSLHGSRRIQRPHGHTSSSLTKTPLIYLHKGSYPGQLSCARHRSSRIYGDGCIEMNKI